MSSVHLVGRLWLAYGEIAIKLISCWMAVANSYEMLEIDKIAISDNYSTPLTFLSFSFCCFLSHSSWTRFLDSRCIFVHLLVLPFIYKYRVSHKKWAFLLKEIEPCGFLHCVRIHIKYLNQADQIFRSLFSNVNKHPNISYENKENNDLKL